MTTFETLTLTLHPADYANLRAAAARSGQDLATLARLALHKEARARLAEPARTRTRATAPLDPGAPCGTWVA